MERREDLSFGFTLNDGATETYRIAPRNENFNLFGGPTAPVASPAAIVAPSASAPAQPLVKSPPPAPAPAQIPATLPVPATSLVSGAAGVAVTADGKKKRGRPRKYGPDGKLAMPLCPMPISSSVPLTGDFSGWKRGRGRPGDSIKKSHKLDTHKQLQHEGSGERIDYNAGANFTPHMITVNAGEDVTMKIMLFSQQGARAICILSANGMISNVTLRQPTSSGGTLTYEGRFEILSLSGSFMPTDNGGTKSRSGGMSVSLAGPDGRVLGGGLAGLLVAAGPVQVIVGSFLAGNQQEHKVKKHRIETASTVIPSSTNLVFGENLKGVYGGAKPILSPFNGAPSPMQGGFGNSPADNSISFSEDDSKDNNNESNCEVSC